MLTLTNLKPQTHNANTDKPQTHNADTDKPQTSNPQRWHWQNSNLKPTMLTLTNLKPQTHNANTDKPQTHNADTDKPQNHKPTMLTLTNLKPQTQNVDTDKPRSVSPMLQQTQLSTAQQVYDLLLLWSPCVTDQQTLCTFISAHHILIFTQQRMPWTARHARCCYVYNKKVLRLECKSQPAHRCCTCNTVVCSWCQSDHTHTAVTASLETWVQVTASTSLLHLQHRRLQLMSIRPHTHSHIWVTDKQWFSNFCILDLYFHCSTFKL